ncbi:MAG TPA: MXAN_6640 family putative metalloprotease [Polyangiaceae bacterium]|nr:MXAN_6640 family putative metalloprotease [Polyangiaceae bacterium]
MAGLSGVARAQSCENARPTEPGATKGLSYGNAELSYYDSASGRVRVHFALSGTHAPPAVSTLEPDFPDAVVIAAQAADSALDKYAELGYRVPLGDGDSPCSSNGDSDAIDIYLIQFAGADGQITLDHCEAGSPKRCAGFALVENDFRGGPYADVAEGLRTVVPHELFHLVQDSYDADVERWWAEGSAQWAAKQVFPELLDLQRFLPAYFDNPWRPLNVPPSGVVTSFLYATAIWPVFLEQRHDASLVREVYDGLGQSGDDVLPTTDRVLAAHGSSLSRDFLQFAAFNAATGSRAPESGGYLDAAGYPEVDFEALAQTRGELASDVMSGMGAFYYSLTASEPTELSLDADATRVAALLAPIHDGKVALDAAQPLPATLDGEGVVIVAGQSLARTDAPFVLRGAAPSSGAGGPGTSSGCSVARVTPQVAPGSGVLLGFVVILSRRRRARRRAPRKRSS